MFASVLGRTGSAIGTIHVSFLVKRLPPTLVILASKPCLTKTILKMNKLFLLVTSALSFVALSAFTACKKDDSPGPKETKTLIINNGEKASPPMVEISVEKGSTVSEPTIPTRPNATFKYWYEMPDKTKAFDFSTPITFDMTIHALWELTVKFDANIENVADPEDVKVLEGDKLKELPTLIHETAVFEGWVTEDDVVFDAMDTPINESMTLYGKWKGAGPFLLTFNAADGTPVADIQVDEVKVIPEPETSREQYTFDGWYNGDQRIDFTQPIKESMDLVAHWVPNQKITYNGVEYPLITVGSAVWFGADLRTTQLNDGTAIVLATSPTEWGNNTATIPLSYYPLGNPDNVGKVTKGLLYNFAAIATGKLCPEGYHVSTDADWKAVESLMGMEAAELDMISMTRGAEQEVGMTLKSMNPNSDWNTLGTNESGLTFSHVGGIDPLGNVEVWPNGAWSNWWTSTLSGDLGLIRSISGTPNEQAWVNRYQVVKSYGFGVRCVKDAE